MPSLRPAVLVLLLTASAACSASNGTGVFTTGTGSGGSGGASTTGTAASTGEGVGGSFTTGVGGGGTGGSEPPLVAEVWGQSPDTLYKLDPTNNAVTTIGKFKGCAGGVIDIALDKDSNLYGTATGSLFHIDKVTAQCTLISNGSYPNSLSFVPAGTVDPVKEALVGYLGSQYIRIDPVTGKVTTIGQLGGGYSSSGDVVSVKGKTFLTANGSDCVNGDCLLEIDPKTGDLVKNWGEVGYNAVFGLAFWAGKAYGFTDPGDLFEISFTMTGITTKKISIPGNPTLQFWGAGSTTSAPVDPVPQ
jgi:hypothetical protein